MKPLPNLKAHLLTTPSEPTGLTSSNSAYGAQRVKFSPFHCGPDQMADYVEYMADNSSSSTIRRRIASISSVLKLSGNADPTKSPEVVLALKRMHRKKGRAQQQAAPLTKSILNQLLNACESDTKGLRDAVILNLGYETMRRRSELCRFKFEDIVKLPNEELESGLIFQKRIS